MTYIVTDKSIQNGNPALLFSFSRDGVGYYYNNTTQNIVYLGNTYLAGAISISGISQSSEIEKSTIDITIPRDNPFAQVAISTSAETPTSITVYRHHITDTDNEFVVYWKGRVSSHDFSKDAMKVNCEPIFTSVKRAGLRARYQKVCRHALYLRGCNVVQANYANAAIVTAVSGENITLQFNPNASSTYFSGGIISYNGVQRYIASHSGVTLKLFRSFEILAAEVSTNGNTAVTIYPGCDYTRTTCNTKFNNILNFGGFPWIPNKNPMGGSSII